MQERRLSPKMRTFAKLVSGGCTPSESYRRAYVEIRRGCKSTLGSNPTLSAN